MTSTSYQTSPLNTHPTVFQTILRAQNVKASPMQVLKHAIREHSETIQKELQKQAASKCRTVWTQPPALQSKISKTTRNVNTQLKDHKRAQNVF